MELEWQAVLTRLGLWDTRRSPLGFAHACRLLLPWEGLRILVLAGTTLTQNLFPSAEARQELSGQPWG